MKKSQDNACICLQSSLKNSAYVCSYLLSSLVSLRDVEVTFRQYWAISIKENSKQNATVVFDKSVFYLWNIRQTTLSVTQKPTGFERRRNTKSCLTKPFVWNKSANGIETCFNSGRERHRQETRSRQEIPVLKVKSLEHEGINH